jgi:hypothetical protein
MLRGNPEFLVINGASRAETVAFAVVLSFAPPLLAVGIEATLGILSAKSAGVVHVLFLWAFGFTAGLQVLELFDPTRGAAIIVPLVAAYGGAIAYTRWRAIHTFLSLSFALPVIALLVFVSTAPLALANSEGADVRVRSHTPVVLVVLDEFAVSSLMRPDGSIDSARFPGFGRLSHDATWYSRATTVHESTTQAVPAILTGDLPRKDALPTLADEPHNLFTLLGETYTFKVREAITRLCPVRYCPDHASSEPLFTRVTDLFHDVGINFLYGALPAGLRGDVTPLREGWGALVEDTGLNGDALVRTVRPSDPPRTLYFAHIVQPHVPWQWLPSGHRYGDKSVIEGITDDWEPGKYEQWRDHDPWLVTLGLQRHLLQIGYVDRFVRRLLDRLEETGIYDRAMIIVTADHGVSFRAGGLRRRTTPENVSDIAGVPLFVKYPGQLGGQEDRRAASSVDILPTIADVLGIRLPWPVDGRSLRGRALERNVTIGRQHEPALVSSPEAVAAGVLETARRNSQWFGTGTDSLYRFGPRRELIGRAVVSFPQSQARGAHILLPRAAELASVRKSSGYVPVHILGRISWSSLRPKEDLAVAVNGRIALVTRPFTSTGDTWFAVLIDESRLHDGNNSVEVFAARGAGRGTRLLRIGGTGERSVASTRGG